MEEDELMGDLYVPEVFDRETVSRLPNRERKDAAEWSSDEDMKPGLLTPSQVKYHEIARVGLFLAAIVYLAGWSVLAGWLVSAGGVSGQDLAMLLSIFVTPVMSVVGFAAGYYYKHHRMR